MLGAFLIIGYYTKYSKVVLPVRSPVLDEGEEAVTAEEVETLLAEAVAEEEKDAEVDAEDEDAEDADADTEADTEDVMEKQDDELVAIHHDIDSLHECIEELRQADSTLTGLSEMVNRHEKNLESVRLILDTNDVKSQNYVTNETIAGLLEKIRLDVITSFRQEMLHTVGSLHDDVGALKSADKNAEFTFNAQFTKLLSHLYVHDSAVSELTRDSLSVKDNLDKLERNNISTKENLEKLRSELISLRVAPPPVPQPPFVQDAVAALASVEVAKASIALLEKRLSAHESRTEIQRNVWQAWNGRVSWETPLHIPNTVFPAGQLFVQLIRKKFMSKEYNDEWLNDDNKKIAIHNRNSLLGLSDHNWHIDGTTATKRYYKDDWDASVDIDIVFKFKSDVALNPAMLVSLFQFLHEKGRIEWENLLVNV